MLVALPSMRSPPSSPSLSVATTAADELERQARRPRRARCKWSAQAKLPKMNNSERGKFYRKKYKDYERQLESDVMALRVRVKELQLLAALRRQLSNELHVVDPSAVAAVVLERLEALSDAPSSSSSTASSSTASSSTTCTRFELKALTALGASDALVVVLSGKLRVLETRMDAPERELAARPCSYRLLFSADCMTHELLADVDTSAIAIEPRREDREVKDVTVGIASASLGRLPGVRQLMRLADRPDGYSSAGTVGGDYHAGRRRNGEVNPLGALPMFASVSPPMWPPLALGKRPRAMTMDFILS